MNICGWTYTFMHQFCAVWHTDYSVFRFQINTHFGGQSFFIIWLIYHWEPPKYFWLLFSPLPKKSVVCDECSVIVQYFGAIIEVFYSVTAIVYPHLSIFLFFLQFIYVIFYDSLAPPQFYGALVQVQLWSYILPMALIPFLAWWLGIAVFSWSSLFMFAPLFPLLFWLFWKKNGDNVRIIIKINGCTKRNIYDISQWNKLLKISTKLEALANLVLFHSEISYI